MTRYRKSHLVEATYFIQDTKASFTFQYSTNSHGKRIASAIIKDKYDTKIPLGSYKEIQDMIAILQKGLTTTRGKWYYEKKKKKV